MIGEKLNKSCLVFILIFRMWTLNRGSFRSLPEFTALKNSLLEMQGKIFLENMTKHYVCNKVYIVFNVHQRI